MSGCVDGWKAHIDVIVDECELLQRGKADVGRQRASQELVCEVQACQAWKGRSSFQHVSNVSYVQGHQLSQLCKYNTGKKTEQESQSTVTTLVSY